MFDLAKLDSPMQGLETEHVISGPTRGLTKNAWGMDITHAHHITSYHCARMIFADFRSLIHKRLFGRQLLSSSADNLQNISMHYNKI